ncbi:MAG: serine protease [Clostridiales bacterium]|nr:serine protease [Clostridiales bacterium]
MNQTNQNRSLWILCTTAAILSIVALVIAIWKPAAHDKRNHDTVSGSVVTIVTGIDLEKEILTSDVVIGTGFCYQPHKIITNYHNIQKNSDAIYLITNEQQAITAKLIAKDEISDIALLEIETELPALSFADSAQCQKGQTVFSIATPISVYLQGTYAEGFITNLDIVGFGTQRLLQTNIDLSPGCSGGPLLNEHNQVIGMTTFKSTEFGAEGLGFAVPSNRLQEVIDRLEQGIETPNLQITFQNDIYQKYGVPGAKGLRIQEISEESPVFEQLQEGDLLIKINNQSITNLVEYHEALQKVSETFAITIVRDAEIIDISIDMKS